LSLISLVFISCSSSNRAIKSLKSQVTCDKIIHIVLDPENKFTRIESRGTSKNNYISFSKSKRINYTSILKTSLEKINKKHKTRFIYKSNHGFPSDSIVQVTLKMDKIVWNKGFSKAQMEVLFTYSVNDQKFTIVGISKFQSIASIEKSILQCLEHSNLQFLIAYCENEKYLSIK